ncbi:MAG: hypothetical protein R3F61_18235 [Myxococcota bacterium]
MRSLPLLALALAACSSDDTPTWAIDVMFVAPDGEGVRGTTSWQVYRKAWEKGFKERHYLCSVVVAFEGVPSAVDCPSCLAAMSVTSEVTDSDCPESLASSPTFVSLSRIGFGPIQAGGPFPDRSSVGFADYGPGWEVHGWSYPDALALGESTEAMAWDGTEPFSMAPSYAWYLDPTPGAAAVSRLAIEDAGPASP